MSDSNMRNQVKKQYGVLGEMRNEKNQMKS